MRFISTLALAVLAAGCSPDDALESPYRKESSVHQAKVAVLETKIFASDLGRDPQLQLSTVGGPNFFSALKNVTTQVDSRLDGTYAVVSYRGDLDSQSNYSDPILLLLRTEEQRKAWDRELEKYFKPRDVLPPEAK